MRRLVWIISITTFVGSSAVLAASPVVVDVRPGDPASYIDTESTHAAVPVAILTSDVADGDPVSFNAGEVDGSTVRFGPAAAVPDTNSSANFRDVDNDGDIDVEFLFHVPATGIQCEETSTQLTGSTLTGEVIESWPTISTPDCPQCHDSDSSYRKNSAGTDEYFFVTEDTPLNVSDPAEYGFSALEQGTQHGELSVNPDGAFSYLPAENYFGMDEFVYTDDFATSVTVNISVTPVNDVPVGMPDAIGIAAGTDSVRDAPGVMANDTDVDGDPITAELVTDVSNGQLTLDGDGAFSYTPGPAFTGHDSFIYRVSDGTAWSDDITVNISLPNIIVIMVDDMGQGDTQIYNNGAAFNLPNLEALAGAGLSFTRAHSPSPACSPTRYSLLTGNHPYRGRQEQGVWKAFDPDPMLLPGQLTLGDMARAANYRTAYIGKTHDGAALHNDTGTGYTRDIAEADFSRPLDKAPTQFGFDYSFIIPGGIGSGPYAYFENDRLVRYDEVNSQYFPFSTAESAREKLINVTNGQNFNGGIIGTGGVAIDNYDSRQVGSAITERASNFIVNHLQTNATEGDQRPFLLYLAPPQAHTPWTPPPVFNPVDPDNVEVGATNTAVAGVTQISARTDSVYESDLILGSLVSKLDEEGILDNTLIIFTSDNSANAKLSQSGYSGVGERIETGPGGLQHFNAQGADNGVPLRGKKGVVYEGGHRVPLILRWGDGSAEGSLIEPGTQSSQFIALHDLMMTLADILGVTLPPDQANDSYSYRSLLLGEQTPGIMVRDHLFVQGGQSATYGNMDRAFYMKDEAGDEWKLIAEAVLNEWDQNIQFTQLYNLSADPGESANLINDTDVQTWLSVMTSNYLALIGQNRTAN